MDDMEALRVLEDAAMDREWTDAEHAAVFHALDAVGRVLGAASNDAELRTRAAKAYYRCAARGALIGNERTEYQKAWRVKLAKGRGGAALVLDVWASSEDPHAPFVAALMELRPDLKPKDVATLASTVMEGTAIDDLDEIESMAKGTGNKIRKAVAKVPELVEAVERWLPSVAPDDVRRRVFHAGSVYAAGGDQGRLTALASALPADRLEWAEAVWAYCAP